MTKLTVYSTETHNIFGLHGSDEDDFTKAIAWTFAQCNGFLERFLTYIGLNAQELPTIEIRSQKRDEDARYDVEIVAEGSFDLLIEAKRGTYLPTEEQLIKYYDRLRKRAFPQLILVSLTNATITDHRLEQIEGLMSAISYRHITYFKLVELATEAAKNTTNHKEKYWLKTLRDYFWEEVLVNWKNSNSVYVVSIKKESIIAHDQQRQYRCPVGGRYTAHPVNYIGFRYGGKLQAINHVESCSVECDDSGKEYYVFALGPDIVPDHPVKTGKGFRSIKCYCDIDLLLTSNSLRDAFEETKKRK